MTDLELARLVCEKLGGWMSFAEFEKLNAWRMASDENEARYEAEVQRQRGGEMVITLPGSEKCRACL